MKTFIYSHPVFKLLPRLFFYNLVPKSSEYDCARGCVLLIVYCFLAKFSINIPLFILDQICAANLVIPTKGLPFGMLFTRLFSHWHIPVDGLELINLTCAIYSSFLLRKRSHISSSDPSQEDELLDDPDALPLEP